LNRLRSRSSISITLNPMYCRCQSAIFLSGVLQGTALVCIALVARRRIRQAGRHVHLRRRLLIALPIFASISLQLRSQRLRFPRATYFPQMRSVRSSRMEAFVALLTELMSGLHGSIRRRLTTSFDYLKPLVCFLEPATGPLSESAHHNSRQFAKHESGCLYTFSAIESAAEECSKEVTQ
jgi:hypothetical protein